MSVTRVAIPVLRGKMMVLVDKGRPWSVIEHLLLEALAKQEWTAKELSEAASVSRRVIIEAIIRLMRAGWVEISRSSGVVAFRANSYGLAAAAGIELPNVLRRIRRPISFIVDQVGGDVFRNREWFVFEEHALRERAKKEKIVWIRPESVSKSFDPNQFVDTLLDDDEKFVDAEPSGLSRRFVLATVRNGAVEGLPARELAVLRAAVLAAADSSISEENAQTHTFSVPGVVTKAISDVPSLREIAFNANDFLLDGDAHRRQLEQILQSASTRIYIHSTFIDEQKVLDWLPQITAAARRGVRIHLFWGQSEDKNYVVSSKSAVGSLRRNAKILELDGNLVIYPFSTMSHAKLIVADSGRADQFLAVVGSCNWFTSDFKSYEASIVLRDSRIVCDVVKYFSALSCIDTGVWSGLTSELVSLSQSLERMPPSEIANALASVVIGGQHEHFCATRSRRSEEAGFCC